MYPTVTELEMIFMGYLIATVIGVVALVVYFAVTEAQYRTKNYCHQCGAPYRISGGNKVCSRCGQVQ